ncbi:hypothetical protein WME73_20710 [Sorangium sp. So ce302]|uniref:hypothetical protein n=1 Tax=Sorangium sp. So ce302 TaxID=3133297 RepID=UPI003F624293
MAWIHKRLTSVPPGLEYWTTTHERDWPEESHLRILENTFWLIPSQHRSIIDHVEFRGRGQQPRSGGGNNGHVIRLSHESVRARLNNTPGREFNITFLHEFGHLVDMHYQVTRYVMRRRDAAGRALLRTGHTGVTQMAGERIADCYMIYLLQELAGVPYQHPADPSAYRGEQARDRFDVLLQSPAFAGIAASR